MDSRKIRIYLSGSVKKGRDDNRNPSEFWTADDENFIFKKINLEVVLLNPSKSPISRNDYFVNYGCDLYLVESADVVLVDLRGERGIGVGAELMYAQFREKCVVGC
jgi:hypothetical protein